MNKPKRILHIVGAMNRAGTETMLMNIYRNIDREKIQFDFISYSHQDAHYDEEISRLGGKVIKLTNTQSIKQIVQAIRRNGPYIAVHSHTLFHCGTANIAAKLAGIPIRIAHAHTTLDHSDSVIRKVYIRLMRNIIMNVSTHYLACSKQAGHYLFGQKGVNKPVFHFFPNLIDYAHFLEVEQDRVEHFKEEAGLQGYKVIGHIGRFIEAKNHRFLLDILKHIVSKDPKWKLLLVGDGDLRDQIEERAKTERLGNHIVFVGVRSDIPTMLHSMDVFVFPSIYEGLGLVLLEAQASGVPCIVSEAVQPEADLNINLVSKLSLEDSADVWANKVLSIIGKREEEKGKIINGFKKSGYEFEKGIFKLMKLYEV
ncbi:glycosyltransferase family 1 protein [Fredinandcohnia sp. 179-A 10B2 NHS]|uniref:glycosyltransferase family 1 protein n=1 Tax=Fredinandcohnia sp. 179-A 10B2 NHS TaxID=3235176 RepID=UPI0039A3B586